VLPVALLAAAGCGFPDDWGFASDAEGGAGGKGGASGGSSQGGSNTGGGSGGVGECTDTAADCDGDAANGCEASLTSAEHCGACFLPCALPNVANPCGTGKCEIVDCEPGFADCDGVPGSGCEVDTRADAENCGMCDEVCVEPNPACVNSLCSPCPADMFEPNESIHAPSAPPLPAAHKPLDAADNNFLLTANRAVVVTPTFPNVGDKDVFYLNVIDDLPPPMMGETEGSGYDFTLTNIPDGATYKIDAYFICNTGSLMTIFNSPSDDCPIGGANTGNVGSWWHCEVSSPAPSDSWLFGQGCDSGDHGGILQLEVSVVTPPTLSTCDPYTLTVRVFGISVPP